MYNIFLSIFIFSSLCLIIFITLDVSKSSLYNDHSNNNNKTYNNLLKIGKHKNISNKILVFLTISFFSSSLILSNIQNNYNKSFFLDKKNNEQKILKKNI
ncbi:hypothetical protein RJX39_01340 [Buchnera aphidicola (Taiwanaphis decaspermi)]|uniref:hypothetical protein n=1 Tax=Buchnera aphidicola TaxID=9 RepID=UPI0031B80411